MNTLVHEEIFAYTDTITSLVETKTGTNINFTNNAVGNIVDPGVLEITVTSGSFTSLKVTIGSQQMIINKALALNNKLILDLRTNVFKLNGALIFTDKILDFSDNLSQTVNLTFTGTGQSSVKYTRDTVTTQSNDLDFIESLSVEESIEFQSKTNIKNQKQIKGKGVSNYTFSLSFLWNETQSVIFPKTFRLRLVDETGKKLETLAGCRVTSIRKGSSSNGGDYTFEVSGTCEKIY